MRTQWVGMVLLLSAGCAAAENDFYVGAGAGIADVAFDHGLDGNDTALQAFAGYSFNRYFAAELGYLDAGSVKSRFGAALETTGVTATALGSLPLGERWSIFAGAGVLRWTWKSAGIERSGSNFMYAVGGELTLGRIRIRLEGGATHLGDDEMRLALLHGLWSF